MPQRSAPGRVLLASLIASLKVGPTRPARHSTLTPESYCPSDLWWAWRPAALERADFSASAGKRAERFLTSRSVPVIL